MKRKGIFGLKTVTSLICFVLIIAVYLVCYSIPLQEYPAISTKAIENAICAPVFSAYSRSVEIVFLCMGTIVCLAGALAITKTILEYYQGKLLAKSIRVLLLIFLPLTPIVMALETDILKTPIGTPLCLLASLAISLIFWIIFLFIADTGTRLFGWRDIFTE